MNEGFGATAPGPSPFAEALISKNVGHSGACGARSRNLTLEISGPTLTHARNDLVSYATILSNTAISASGAVTFGEWLASISK